MKKASDSVIREIYQVLEERRDQPIDSYTSHIMRDDDKNAEDKILEKIGEESAELIIASKNDENLIYEASRSDFPYTASSGLQGC